MSEDQIYEIVKMVLTVLISIFGGYQLAKNTIKINVSQTQITELKMSIQQISSQITELKTSIDFNNKQESSSTSTVNSPIINNIYFDKTSQASDSSTGSREKNYITRRKIND